MRVRRSLWLTVALGTVTWTFPLLGSPLGDLQNEMLGTRAFRLDGRISRLYGSEMARGGDFYVSAENFLRDHADVLGLRRENLYLKTNVDGNDFQPVMLNRETGKYKFVALYFGQIHEGLEVYGGEVTLLFRLTDGFPLVEVISNIKDVANVKVAENGFIAATSIGQHGYQPDDRGDVRKVIYLADDQGEGDLPTVAFTYIVTEGHIGDDIKVGLTGDARDGAYDRRRVFVDAQTGALLHSESLVRAIDVEGNVSGWSTPGLLPDVASNQAVIQVLPRVWVDILSGNRGEANLAGDYVISHGGGDEVTVRSRMYGPSLSLGVNDLAGGEILLDLNVTPPGPADFLHNTGRSEFDTAEVNAMLHTALVHDFLGAIVPNFPNLNRSFRANVNSTQTCNAFYDGQSINFFQEGGGCVNTAYSTIIYHEYGHKIVGDGATAPTGDYHEGLSDVVSQVITDDPVVAQDWRGPGTMIRSGDNNRQYPCGGEVHFCGQVISGCVWHTREALILTEPDDYRALLADWAINSVLLHAGGIDPGITIDFLTLDDDDNDITNGTPHYDEINEGFSRHNMAAPPIKFLDFDYPDGRPSVISPDGGTTMRVVVAGLVNEPKAGTGRLYLNDGSGWIDLAMTDLGSNVYDAVFPPVNCPTIVEFYVSAETVDGAEITDPASAPSTTFSAIGASNVFDVLIDDFETDQGWTVENVDLIDGPWERGVPAGGGVRGDPAEDFDGSGRCFITDNVEGNSDVDGGPTRLISPIFNMSGGDGFVSYARWFTNDDRDGDRLTVEISNDGGSNWTLVRSVGDQAGWVKDTFLVSDFVSPSAEMRLRFSATDNPNDSVTEAGIDAVEIVMASCGAPGGLFLTVAPLVSGEQVRFTSQLGTIGKKTFFAYSLRGLGDTPVPALNVTLGILNPKLAGSASTNNAGFAVIIRPVPQSAGGLTVWMQSAEQGRISNIVNQVIQ